MNVEEIDTQASQVRTTLSSTELRIVSGALNEVCNGVTIADWEFSIRMGVTKTEARALLDEISPVLDTLLE